MKNVILLFLLIVAAHFNAQSQGYDIIGEAVIYITETDSIETRLGFSWSKNAQVVDVDNNNKIYKAGSVAGVKFKGVREYISAKSMGMAQFVQVVTPQYNKMKIVKQFVPDSEGSKEGVWLIYLYHVSKKALYQGSKKVGEALKVECPELATKIAKKEQGYVVNLSSTEEETIQAFTRIIEDAETGCK